MVRWWIIGGLLLAHGFVHARWRTYAPRTSRLFALAPPGTLSLISGVLFAVSALGFGLAGLGAMARTLWWPAAAAASALASLTLLGIFWQPAFAFAAAVNVAVLLFALWMS
jgi:hypothetical protein